MGRYNALRRRSYTTSRTGARVWAVRESESTGPPSFGRVTGATGQTFALMASSGNRCVSPALPGTGYSEQRPALSSVRSTAAACSHHHLTPLLNLDFNTISLCRACRQILRRPRFTSCACSGWTLASTYACHSLRLRLSGIRPEHQKPSVDVIAKML
jgi:hypothetical protein